MRVVTQAQPIEYDERTGVIHIINPRAHTLKQHARMLNDDGYEVTESNLMGWAQFTHVVHGEGYDTNRYYLAQMKDAD